MHILGVLGMYFDAVVVEVKIFFTYIQFGSGHTVKLRRWCKKRNVKFLPRFFTHVPNSFIKIHINIT